MEFVNDPQKSKRIFILMLVLTILFFVSSGALGYFYFKQHQKIQDLSAQNEELQKQNETSTADLQKQIQTLETQIKDHEAKLAKIKAYNEFYKYLNSVIKTHNGFTGWTEAEYQKGRKLAQATGDQSFVDKIDWAWKETSVDPNTRVIAVWEDIASGIEKNLP